MYRLFTLEEATGMIPTVATHLESMQDASRELERVQERLEALRPFTVEAVNAHREAAFLVHEVHSHKAELDRLGVIVKDVEAGVVDFPSQLGAEVVWLSWEQGTDGITHYQRIGEEVSKPIPEAAAARR